MKKHWIDPATDMDCLIVENGMGFLCGYVAVTEGHPAFQKDYNDVDVNVHGGLTYADFCQENGKICHVPLPGRPHKVWWLGFDCAHGWDIPRLGGTLKDETYVKAECESLAKQLKEMANAEAST